MERIRGFDPATGKTKEIWLPKESVEQGPIVCKRFEQKDNEGLNKRRWHMTIGDNDIILTNYSKSKLLPSMKRVKKGSKDDTTDFTSL